MIEYSYYGAARGSAQFYVMTDWCRETFGPFSSWYELFPFIIFRDEKEYEWFLLRWA